MPVIKDPSLMTYPPNLVDGGGGQGAAEGRARTGAQRRLAATLDGRTRP
jgi:hypothetical protein